MLDYAVFFACDNHGSSIRRRRSVSAEAETQRLDILVAKLIAAMKERNKHTAESFEQCHDDDRIRPETVRPIVDRPLAP